MNDPTTANQSKAIIDAAAELLQPVAKPIPIGVQDWLGQTALLYGVPFEHLVPDVRMLPQESIRFFYVDANWIESLIDGAFSTGVHSDRDIRFHRVLQDQVREATDIAAGKFREKQLAASVDSNPPIATNSVRAGFLLRSAIVSGFPGMEVEAFEGASEESAKLPPLRIERLAPDILLVIFPSIPGLVRLTEPSEGFHFGTSNDSLAGVRIPSEFEGTKTQARSAPKIEVPYRDKALGILDVNELATRLASHPKSEASGFDSADFAFQMIDPPDQKAYVARPENPQG